MSGVISARRQIACNRLRSRPHHSDASALLVLGSFVQWEFERTRGLPPLILKVG